MRYFPQLVEMDDDDPRYVEMQRLKHEARIRYGKSEEARLEALAITDPNRIRPGWTVAKIKPRHPFKVVAWDKQPSAASCELLHEMTQWEFHYALADDFAVALWAERYDVMREQQPQVREDAMVRGDRAAAHAIEVALREEGVSVQSFVKTAHKVPFGQGAAFVMKTGKSEIHAASVKVVERLPVLDPPGSEDEMDAPLNGLVMCISGIQVLDPISLLICKAAAWNDRKQKEGYNDATHIAMLETIVPAFVKEARERGVDVSDRLAQLHDVVKTYPLPVPQGFWDALD